MKNLILAPDWHLTYTMVQRGSTSVAVPLLQSKYSESCSLKFYPLKSALYLIAQEIPKSSWQSKSGFFSSFHNYLFVLWPSCFRSSVPPKSMITQYPHLHNEVKDQVIYLPSLPNTSKILLLLFKGQQN